MRMPLIGTFSAPAVLLVVSAGAAAAAAALWLHNDEVRAERRIVEGRAEMLAEALELSITEAMAEHRRESIGAVVEALALTEGVAGLAVAGADGGVRHSVGEAPARVEPAKAQVWSEGRLVLTRDVPNGASCRACHGAGEAAGAVLVSLDASALRPRLAASAQRKAALSLLGFAATVTVVLLVRRIQDRNAALAVALATATAAREARAADLQRLQAILDSMVDGVLFIDADDRVAMVNQAGRRLRNLTDGPGRPLKECHPRSSHGMLERVMGYLRSGDDAGPPHSIIKEKEGRFETTYAPVNAPDGAYLGTVMVIRDIAERRTLERRLLDAERLSGLGQMSAQIAHELRNPLNAIGGAAQYLRRRLVADPEVAEYATLIGDEVQRVNRFVAALLHVARPVAPVFATVRVSRLLRDAAHKAALARGLGDDAVRVDVAPDLPVLDVDAPMVTEALVNLLQNALDAGGAEPVELASRFETSGGEGTVVLEVRDRGCGIPADQLDEVLRPFVTTKVTGTGLGLVIVTRTAEQHRARFRLERRDGGGTVATLRFPVRRTAVEPERPAGAAAAGEVGA
jgi:signal transduction histidine kinase